MKKLLGYILFALIIMTAIALVGIVAYGLAISHSAF